MLHSVTLPQILARLEREIASAEDISSRLEAALPHSGGVANDSEGLQDLDRLTQTLTCLRQFLSSWGAEAKAEPEIVVPVRSSDVFLGSVAVRLAGGEELGADAIDRGEIDLF